MYEVGFQVWTIVGTVLDELEAQDRDDDELDFVIRGEIANSIIYLDRVGPKKMEIKLKQQLDREVSTRHSRIQAASLIEVALKEYCLKQCL